MKIHSELPFPPPDPLLDDNRYFYLILYFARLAPSAPYMDDLEDAHASGSDGAESLLIDQRSLPAHPYSSSTSSLSLESILNDTELVTQLLGSVAIMAVQLSEDQFKDLLTALRLSGNDGRTVSAHQRTSLLLAVTRTTTVMNSLTSFRAVRKHIAGPAGTKSGIFHWC